MCTRSTVGHEPEGVGETSNAISPVFVLLARLQKADFDPEHFALPWPGV